MNIQSVSVDPLNLELKEPFEISLGKQTAARNVLATVELEDGTRGYGEGSPVGPITGETQTGAIETARVASELILDTNIENYRSLIQTLRSSFPGAVSATLALEMAVLDAYCKRIDIPLSGIFGDEPKPVRTDITVPIVEADAAANQAQRARERGFEHIKIKTGSTLEDDLERVRAVRSSAPEVEIKVDANQGWTPAETIEFDDLSRDEGLNISLIEQPVRADDVTGMAQVREAIKTPVGADETVFTPADALRVVEAQAADVINLKLGKSGLLPARDIVAIAQAANLELMIGCMLESSLGIHAGAHVVAGTGAFSYVDLDANQLLADDIADITPAPVIEPSGPGIGIDPAV